MKTIKPWHIGKNGGLHEFIVEFDSMKCRKCGMTMRDFMDEDFEIRVDSVWGQAFGFTSDKFFGWLWKKGDEIVISFIESLDRNKGNVSRLFRRIEEMGYRIAVPTPLGKMVMMLMKWGYKPEMRNFLDNKVEVWTKCASRKKT